MLLPETHLISVKTVHPVQCYIYIMRSYKYRFKKGVQKAYEFHLKNFQ